MKYRMYVDEVGNPDLESSDNPNHRFLSLTGVVFELDYVQATVFPTIEHLKQQFFGSHPDDPIILHRKEIVNARYPFHVLRDEAVRAQFDRELLRLLSEWSYVVITVCIDKKRHKESYTTWRYDPYHYCLAVLLERFNRFLERNSGVGDVLAESRGGQADIRLKASFERLWEHGTQYVGAERFQAVLTSKQLKVKQKSNNIAGLQVADLLAHPSRCEILHEEGLLGRKLPAFATAVAAVLRNKYDCVGNRMYGKKFL